MSELVRIKKIKGPRAGDHMMVTPAYAARTKMLKNSGWVVEDLPETKDIVSESAKGATFEKSEIVEIIKDTFDEALTEKEAGLALDQQQPKEDPEEITEESQEDNQTVDILNQEEKQEVKAPEPTPRRRGRQPGSTNKPK